MLLLLICDEGVDELVAALQRSFVLFPQQTLLYDELLLGLLG